MSFSKQFCKSSWMKIMHVYIPLKLLDNLIIATLALR